MTPVVAGRSRAAALQTVVGRPEAVAAAIQNGADELLLRPEGFTVPGVSAALAYARVRGVPVLLDLSLPMHDGQLAEKAALLETLYRQGLDGVVTAEPGALRMAKMAAPGCRHIWGAPARNAADIRFAASQDCAGATLSPFLSAGQAEFLLQTSPLPLRVAAIEPLCPAGDRAACLLGREDVYTPCKMACRELYGHEGKAEAPFLAARDLCLLRHIGDFGTAAALTVTPPDPSPEAAALITALARRALDGSPPSDASINAVFAALGRPKPTDRPYTGQGDIFCRDEKPGAPDPAVLESARQSFSGAEFQRVPVRFYALIMPGSPVRLGVDDYEGHTLYVSGPTPARTTGVPLREAEVNTQWYKTTGTFYRCQEARTKLEPNLSLPLPALADLRRAALQALTDARKKVPERPAGGYHPGAKYLPRADSPVITVAVSRLSQITPDLLELGPARLYLPLAEAAANPDRAAALAGKAFPVAVLPRSGEDGDAVSAALTRLYDLGFREALARSPGQAALAAGRGYVVRMDTGAMNTQALKAYKSMGVRSCVLSPALSFERIRAMSHVIDTELVGYGRLPMLLSPVCLIKPKSGLCACENINELTDVRGRHMPLVRDGDHGTMIYHAQKLWLQGREKQWRRIGLWALRLDFTTENPRECAQVTESFMAGGRYRPNAYTTGMYAPAED